MHYVDASKCLNSIFCNVLYGIENTYYKFTMLINTMKNVVMRRNFRVVVQWL